MLKRVNWTSVCIGKKILDLDAPTLTVYTSKTDTRYAQKRKHMTSVVSNVNRLDGQYLFTAMYVNEIFFYTSIESAQFILYLTGKTIK